MTWLIKRRRPDGIVVKIVCDERSQVVQNFYDQEQRGGDVWIEEVDGKRVERKTFES